jgi:hypothetical protein
MTTALAHELDSTGAAVLERVVLQGDLGQLEPAQRVKYYRDVCDSLNLNPLTQPFLYLRLNGQLRLYPTKNCADQLRQIHGISVRVVSAGTEGELFIVRVEGATPAGRGDSDLAAVPIAGLKGEALANAMMKTVTKAKRRLTLSIAGLSWPDEEDMATVPGVQRVAVDPATGEVLDPSARRPPVRVEGELAALTARLSGERPTPPPAPEPEPEPEPEPAADGPSDTEIALRRSLIIARRDKLGLNPGVWARLLKTHAGVTDLGQASLDGLDQLADALGGLGKKG